MTEFSLVGDIGGTNSRFGLVEPGSMAIRIWRPCATTISARLKGRYSNICATREVSFAAIAAIAVAAPVDREHISLTNYDWSFTSESLRLAAKAKRISGC